MCAGGCGGCGGAALGAPAVEPQERTYFPTLTGAPLPAATVAPTMMVHERRSCFWLMVLAFVVGVVAAKSGRK